MFIYKSACLICLIIFVVDKNNAYFSFSHKNLYTRVSVLHNFKFEIQLIIILIFKICAF